MRKGIFILLVVFWLGVFIVPPANSFAQMTIKKPLPLPQQNQASISAVTPKALVLQQGGPAAVVTVEGNYLETILSVLAVKGGLGFSEISVKLVQPWPASRKIELQATANAPVGRGYQLRFFGKAGLMNFRIDVPLAVFSLEVAGKPISQMQIQVPISTLPNQTQTTFMPPVTMVSPKAEIIAITPKTVSLEQGGSPAVVTVEGKYLETIQGIQVIRGGQSMRVVTTKLVQPWPASRKIELQATATAPVAKDYQLRFIGKAGREDFRIDVPLTVFSLEVVGKPTNSMQIRPDFIVTGITFNPANPTTSDRIMITVNMKNQSRAAGVIPAGALTWSANSPRGGGVGGTSYGLAIQPGATFFGGMYFVDPGEVAAGSYAVTAKVDPDNRCIEFNEDNNQLTTTLVIGAASGPLQQADMVVTEMALEPPQITTATDFRVRVTVKNQGIVAANFLPGSLILGGPDLYYQYADNNSTSFAPGESRTYRLVKGHVTAGTFTWKTIVDPGNRIKETDENNNEKSIQVTIGQPESTTGFKPDFIVTGITFNPANPTTSDRIMITVNMKNQSRAAGVIPAGALTWSANSPRGGGVGGTSYGLAIQPGATFFGGMYFVDPGEVAAGSYAVTAKVDPDNRCIEFNEDNNQLTTTLVIGAASGPPQQADMVVTEMALEPPQITTATDFRVRVTVKNQGIVAANFLPGSLILGGPDLYYQYADNNSTSFAPGESRTYRLIKGNVTAGTFTWKTIVDPEKRIREIDENNNEKSIQVTIGQPGQDTLRFQTNNQLQVEVPISTFPNQTQTTFKPPVTMVSPKAEIIAITPKTVSLEQGGSPAVVTVEGKYLETIQGIQVIQGGQSVRVITTKLVQPWPASRKIELQAGAAAPVAKNYQLRFIGKAGREDFRIDVPLAVFSLEVAGKPINQMQIQVPISTLPNQTQTTFRPPGTSLALEGTLTVTSPNGGEAWDIRESFLQRISWQSKGSVGSSVKIELYRGETKVHDIKDSSPNTGVLYWEPPNYISYATDYRIKITSLTNQLITDMSDQSFTLGILPGTKAIEVLFKGIQVIDDKDPVGPGELWFEFYVNDKLCGRKPSSQTYSINDNLTQESNIDFNDLSCTIALSEDQAVRVKVIGMDDDSPLPNESLGTAEWHESISILKNRSPYQFYTIKSEDPYCFTVTFQVWIR